ncbi:hypothetical protein SDRG_12942 [Saprolegnia diclina VS20]|uniref:Uncharacterized protein n=1 Tax=Saprolegnia diclina (strain VS20) TaxID=1156394 RepID=T0PUS1_SAPDV|nr:hypothetical protein SDRG_12942 [Saprolegnia diclina VS20]EQC29274.1 hypothetical protein SDRG_12942 [Saprolegnia diclina VS20]|eukprot:XP_008617248.1 hypothetical protein SDRG_12942 [Saprolegnia diclina VS20]
MSPGESVGITADGATCWIRHLSHATIAAVAKAFASVQYPTFHALELRDCELDQYATEKLATTLHAMPMLSLVSVAFLKCVFAEGVVPVLARCFRDTASLRELRLDGCRDLSMTSLMTLTGLCDRVEVLHLTSCKLPRQAGLILGQSLASCEHLLSLVLSHNNLGDGGVRAIADAFDPHKKSHRRKPLGTLELLDLRDNGISNAGFASVLGIGVRHLNVSHNKITSVHELSVRRPSHLCSLDISYNPITAAGFETMAHVISSSTTRVGESLTGLNIENCCLTVDGLQALKQAIEHNPQTTLKELRLGEDNSIEDAKTRVVLSELLECIGSVRPDIECIISPAIVPKVAVTIPVVTDETVDEDVALSSPMSRASTTSAPDVEGIVRQTVATMTSVLETNMTEFMERHEQRCVVDAGLHDVRVKVDALERHVPRVDARLDQLTDRIAAMNAELRTCLCPSTAVTPL